MKSWFHLWFSLNISIPPPPKSLFSFQGSLQFPFAPGKPLRASGWGWKAFNIPKAKGSLGSLGSRKGGGGGARNREIFLLNKQFLHQVISSSALHGLRQQDFRWHDTLCFITTCSSIWSNKVKFCINYTNSVQHDSEVQGGLGKKQRLENWRAAKQLRWAIRIHAALSYNPTSRILKCNITMLNTTSRPCLFSLSKNTDINGTCHSIRYTRSKVSECDRSLLPTTSTPFPMFQCCYCHWTDPNCTIDKFRSRLITHKNPTNPFGLVSAFREWHTGYMPMDSSD